MKLNPKICVILTKDIDNINVDLEANESVRILNEFFKGALLYEFDLNNRNREFIIKFEDVN